MGGKKKDKDKDKEAEQEKDFGKERGKDKAKDKVNNATAKKSTSAKSSSSFKFPEPERSCYVTAPSVLPPANSTDDGEDQEIQYEIVPRKVQMSLMALLKHPVDIFAIDNFFMEDECSTWLEWGEKLGFEDAKQRQTSEYAFRDNGRIEMENEEVAHLLWLRMRPFVPESIPGPSGTSRRAVGCSPRIRVYRYVRGQRFGQHVDGSRDEPTLGGRTHFTVLVYLNGGERDPAEKQVKGGETMFWKDRNGNPTTMALAVPPTRGLCLFHGHGEECMIHEGAPVENGVKYVLRTDVVYEKET
jgi:hypothetical protein